MLVPVYVKMGTSLREDQSGQRLEGSNFNSRLQARLPQGQVLLKSYPRHVVSAGQEASINSESCEIKATCPLLPSFLARLQWSCVCTCDV